MPSRSCSAASAALRSVMSDWWQMTSVPFSGCSKRERLIDDQLSEAEEIAGLNGAGGGVGVHRAMKADALREDVLVGHDPRELRREAPRVHLLLHDRVIPGEAEDAVVAEEVGPAVADVGEVGRVAVYSEHDEGGAHARVSRRSFDLFANTH